MITMTIAEFDAAEIRCEECAGTGGKPSCYLCRGQQTIPIRKALRHGWARGDLEGLDPGDSYCECPACDGFMCDICQGAGTISQFEQDQQLDRILIYCVTGRIPPLFIENSSRCEAACRAGSPNYYPHVVARHDEPQLSAWARDRGERLGLITWHADIFTDYVHLTEAGKIAAVEALTRRDHLLLSAEMLS